ncbi:BLUF domain-containing protein [uncultured Marinobacter sp.]|uniref:BLUF domain-containing protein n=1 Tax=uncultured Marinobacter sp. TaxID=187379 RepID=UPI002631D879|nr:BLUF domain-containing protein [uncultured Marinobacter sp.]
MALIRLAYASEATFEAKPAEQGVEPHVARILMTSRKNNARHEIVGGLYYGDDHFFQYLEGEEEAVRSTFQRIVADGRHRNVRTLIEAPLTQRTFTSWSMKYVPASSDVRRLLSKHGLETFNPVQFSREQCEEMIELIRSSSHDHKLVNHNGAHHDTASPPGFFSKGITFGLIIAAIGLIGALAYAGTLL